MDSKNKTPLRLAAEIGNIQAVKQLLKIQGVDVNLPNVRPWPRAFLNEFYGLTPLQVAAWNGHIEVVKALLADSRVDLNQTQEVFNNSAFTLAIVYGHHEIVRLFLADKRCDFYLGEYHPLFRAAQGGHRETVNLLLLDGRFNINHRLANGATPLFIAAQLGHKEVVELLLQHPLINTTLALNSTAEFLLGFAQRNKVEMAMQHFLQQNDKNPHCILITPRQIAAIMGHEQIVALFDARSEKSIAARLTLGFLSKEQRKLEPYKADETTANIPN